MCLSSSCGRRRRAPHSFPTRRSSDLVDEYAVVVVADLASPQQEYHHRPRAGAGLIALGQIERVWQADVLVDRKSTRLNSSHVRISYAVFCLKKKTIVAVYWCVVSIPV